MLRSFLLSGLVVVGAVNADTRKLEDLSAEFMEDATLGLKARAERADGTNEGVEVYFSGDGFSVVDSDGAHRVQSADVDKDLRGRSVKDMAAFAINATLKAKQMSDGKYRIMQGGNLKGGGPILAACAWASTQAVGWTLALPWLFIPGGQPVFLWTTANTNILATYAASAAAVTPSI